jgi:hypothetical protein
MTWQRKRKDNSKNMVLRIVEKAPTSSNRIVCVRRLKRLGSEKPQSGLRPLWGFLSATFQPTANLRFAL